MKTLYTLSLLLLALILTACQPSQIRNGIPNFPWIAECGSQTQPPVDKKFMANDYGAVADTAQLSTAAIQQAIDACAGAGGGMVSFEPGTYSMGS
ncbi:MAG: glycoside hydrolase family 28 protein, partial [Bacteroidales bacterium]